MNLSAQQLRPGSVFLARVLLFKKEVWLLAEDDEHFSNIIFCTVLDKIHEDIHTAKYRTVEGYIIALFKYEHNEVIFCKY